MSDQLSINRITPNTPSQEYNYQAAQAHQQNTLVQTAVKNVEQSDKKPETKEKSGEQSKQDRQIKLPFRSVEMQFEVNEDTSQVTLKILDKETKQIIRTIPESAWQELSVAELFKISA